MNSQPLLFSVSANCSGVCKALKTRNLSDPRRLRNNRRFKEALTVKYVRIIGAIVGIAGAIGSIIYIRSIYHNILTALPLWMIIGLILFFLAGSNHCVFTCLFCIKKSK